MKTHNHLIEIAVSDECMDISWKTCVKGKTDRPKVKEIIKYYDLAKRKLREKIWEGGFKPLIHKAHIVNDGFKQKIRKIIQPYLSIRRPEQWIQHIVIYVLKPIFMRGMYKYSCGSVPERGVHYGKKYIEKFIRKNPKKIKYVLKLDIHHFYENINIDLLKQRFRKTITDLKFLELVDFVLDSNVGILPDGTVLNKGLPIGYYTSQWFANWFLQPLDHYIKEELRAACYVRYMDDMVIFGSSKRELHKMFIKIREYLTTLDLEIKDNWQVFLFDYVDKNGVRRGRPIDFMGFKFYRDKTTIRKSIFLRAIRLAKRISKKLKISWRDACQLLSYMGWFLPTDTHKAYEKHIKPFVNPIVCRKIVSKHNKKRKEKQTEENNAINLQKGSI